MKNFTLMSIFAGLLIGTGGLVYLRVGGVAGAVLFAFGLLCVVMCGAQLFTGKSGFLPYKDFPKLVLMILLNTIWFSIEPLHTFSLPVKVGPLAGELLSLDLAGVVVFAILCFTYFGSLIKDGKYFAKIDPLVKKNQ